MSTRRTRRQQRRSRGPITSFVALVVTCVIVGVVYLTVSDPTSNQQAGTVRAATAPQGSLDRFMNGPHILFRDDGLGAHYGTIAVTPMSNPGGPRASTNLKCERVAFAHGTGMCMTGDPGLVNTSGLDVFDAKFHVTHHVGLSGFVSRARVAPNGRIGASTVFIVGDSYASNSFSTRTNFFDLVKGHTTGDLANFHVTKNGQPVDSIDRNYWGVTFAADSNIFYATLLTNGHTYLIKGNLARRSATVIHNDVECPALSPDSTRIAYKHREGGQTIAGFEQTATWRLHVLNLRTGNDVALSETRGVDDQPSWFDNATVGYAIPHTGIGVAANDVYTVPANGTGEPRRLVISAWSPALVP